ELREPRIRIHIVERSKELLLRVQIAGCAIAADADSDRARAAALALRLPYRVQDALSDAVEVAIRAAEMRELDRYRVLSVRVLASAALENQLDLDRVFVPLIEMDDRRARPEVVARVLSRNRVHRVGTQLAPARRLGDRFTNLLAHPDLVRAERHFDLE